MKLEEIRRAIVNHFSNASEQRAALSVAERAAAVVEDRLLTPCELTAFMASVNLSPKEKQAADWLIHQLPSGSPTADAGNAVKANIKHIGRLSGLSTERPIGARDKSWWARREWTEAEQELFARFTSDYLHARFNAHDRIDCGDVPYEVLVAFAKLRGLPIRLTNGRIQVTNKSSRPLQTLRAQFNSRSVVFNTKHVPPSDARPGDIAVMARAQSRDGINNGNYFHSYTLAEYNYQKRRALLIYGSEADQIHPNIQAHFEERYGIKIRLGTNAERNYDKFDTVHDFERELIDAVRPDPAQAGRQRKPKVYRKHVSDFLKQQGVDSSRLERATEELIAIIQFPKNKTLDLAKLGYPPPKALQYRQAVQQDGYVLRDMPTIVDAKSERLGFKAATDRDLFADPSLMAHARKELGRAALRQILEAKTYEEARQQLAEAVAGKSGVDPEGLMREIEAARGMRRWDFKAFGRAER